MRKIGVLLALSLVLMSVRADDFGMWTDIGFGQNLGVRGLSADVDFAAIIACVVLTDGVQASAWAIACVLI